MTSARPVNQLEIQSSVLLGLVVTDRTPAQAKIDWDKRIRGNSLGFSDSEGGGIKISKFFFSNPQHNINIG